MAQEKQGIWIARDKNGEIHGFIVKPIRGKDKWEDNYRISDDNFDWSKWHTEFTWENEPIICWHDFRDCCRIYDVISNEINKRS